jgi:hypothetical protein
MIKYKARMEFISGEEMESFLSLIDQIANVKEVKNAIKKEIVETYCAL